MRIGINGWFHDELTTGSGQYLSGLLDAFPRVGERHEFVLICPTRSQPDEPPTLSTNPWRVISIATPFDQIDSHLAKVWFEQFSFPLACRRVGAEIGLTPYWGSPWWRPCPMAVTIHDVIPLLLPHYRGGPLQRGYTWLVARTALRAVLVLTDSEASKRDIVENLTISPRRVRAVHLAVDPRYKRVNERAELARVRARYGTPESPYLLYLGGFDVRKNVERLLRSYAQTAAQHAADVKSWPPLLIAGRTPSSDSPSAPDPVRLAKSLGLDDKVMFTGWVDEADKPALYSMALGVLFLSEYEGFGLPLVEAMACGCPVITAG